MVDFNRFLDNIKAEEELKEKTKLFLNRKLADIETSAKKIEIGKSTYKIKEILASASAMAAIFAFLFAGYIFYKSPVNYISLDINPGVEITLNSFDRVVDIKSANEDGTAINEGIRIINLPVGKAISLLLQVAFDGGYISKDGSSVISISVESDDKDKAIILHEKASEGVKQAMIIKNTFAAIYATTSDLAFRAAAQESGMSPGKYRLIKMLQSMDPEITTGQYFNTSVSEIINKANELSISLKDIDKLDETTQGMILMARATVVEVERNQGKVSESKGQQEQNMISDSQYSQNPDPDNSNSSSQHASVSSQGISGGYSQAGGNSGQGAYSGTSRSSWSSVQSTTSEESQISGFNSQIESSGASSSDSGSGQGGPSGASHTISGSRFSSGQSGSSGPSHKGP